MRISLKTLVLVVLILLVGYLLYIDAGKVTIDWLNYDISTSVTVVVMALVALIILILIYRAISRLFFTLFSKINLNDTLADYIKHIELSSYFDKEIQLSLLSDVTSLKILKTFVRLNELVTKKQYTKALKIIKRKQHKNKLKNLLQYTKVQIMLANKQVSNAAEMCIRYLNEQKKSAWAFLKLLEISLQEEAPNLERFKFLQSLIINKEIGLNKENYFKAYCLIHYQIFTLQSAVVTVKELEVATRRFPSFIPFCDLTIRKLILENKLKEAQEYLTFSWRYDITYENTILCSYFFKEEDKDYYLKAVERLLTNSDASRLNSAYILLAVINAAYENFIEANDALLKVTDIDNPMFRITKLYIYLKENNVKGYNSFITDYVGNLKLRWWNEYITQVKIP